MDVTHAELCVELNVECINCGHIHDLLGPDFEVLNDDNHIFKLALPSSGHWSDAHEKFDEKISCHHCGVEIHVKGIRW